MQKFAYSTFGLPPAVRASYLAEVIDYEGATDHGEERNPSARLKIDMRGQRYARPQVAESGDRCAIGEKSRHIAPKIDDMKMTLRRGSLA